MGSVFWPKSNSRLRVQCVILLSKPLIFLKRKSITKCSWNVKMVLHSFLLQTETTHNAVFRKPYVLIKQ